jgi:hypothetical protein
MTLQSVSLRKAPSWVTKRATTTKVEGEEGYHSSPKPVKPRRDRRETEDDLIAPRPPS